jgi:hypothetical protein
VAHTVLLVVEVMTGLTVILVVQVKDSHKVVTVQVIVDTPGLNEPLASFPAPPLFVAPEI